METKMRQERKSKGWTLGYVARQVGVTKSAIHDIETGRRKPSYEVLVKLLDLFGYKDPRELFAEAPETTNLKNRVPRAGGTVKQNHHPNG